VVQNPQYYTIDEHTTTNVNANIIDDITLKMAVVNYSKWEYRGTVTSTGNLGLYFMKRYNTYFAMLLLTQRLSSLLVAC